MTEQEKKWVLKYRNTAENQQLIRELAKESGLSETMAKLLVVRGYDTVEKIRDFFEKADSIFHDPNLMCDMDKAVSRISAALADHERIVIYGDYDVDGVTSVSLLYLYLKEKGADVGYYIPNRIKEGYGVSEAALDTIAERGADLMITVDNGITAIEEIAYAKSLGIETVVTDHHECRNDYPDACAVVNPHRKEDTYPFKDLAGVGVIFKVICACEMAEYKKKGIPEIDAVRRMCAEYADLVAIGTISDVMPLVDENRLIVSYGLSLLENTKRPGLRALIDAVSGNSSDGKKKKINSSLIGFGLAPRINAAGRVSSASIAVELLLSDTAESADRYAKELCNLNAERQVEENRIAEQAYRKIEEMPKEDRERVIVLDDDGWQHGIIGIVSSRITERYGLPSILISFDGATRGFPSGDDLGKGSGRSVKGMNLVGALTACEDLLVQFGGHELAAGLTVRRNDVEAFRKKINAYAKECFKDAPPTITLEADCEIKTSEISPHLVEEISMMEPFGTSNPVPMFVLRDVKITKLIPLGDGKHTKLFLEKDGTEWCAIRFGVGIAKIGFSVGERVDVLFQLSLNEFRGVTTLQLLLQDIRCESAFAKSCEDDAKRFAEITDGATFKASEDLLPSRDDFALVYSLLRNEYRNGNSIFSVRRILTMTDRKIGYIKLKLILAVMRELHLCGISEPVPDKYIFDFRCQPEKTSIENSSILRRWKSQMREE